MPCQSDWNEVAWNVLSYRHFHLYLQKKRGVLAKDFRLIAVDEKNNEREVDLNVDNLYQGYVLGKFDPLHTWYTVFAVIRARALTKLFRLIKFRFLIISWVYQFLNQVSTTFRCRDKLAKLKMPISQQWNKIETSFKN